jgi:signal peptidase II
MDSKKQNCIYVGLSLGVMATDGLCKAWAKRHLSEKREQEVCGGRIRLRLLYNPGAALGFLKKRPQLLLAGNSLLLGSAIGCFLQELRREGEPLKKLALALLVGGGSSNLIDRVRQGSVTDYFSIRVPERLKSLGKVVFNLSDACVFLGTFLYLISKSIPCPVRNRAASASQDASKL